MQGVSRFVRSAVEIEPTYSHTCLFTYRYLQIPTAPTILDCDSCSPKDATGPRGSSSKSETNLEVELIFQARQYNITYQSPMDPATMPIGIKTLASKRQYSLCKIQPLNNTKPLVLGFPSKDASMVAEFFVPGRDS
ncbi:hypothetical protein PG997_010597 [Apiospora hydei]|uniref:Uncharacterized protein n=1 Tax=Apiospora hydei TaxID=1337664 RepID=A0ABR1VGM9_9PEZI